jgi:hypothetical protein
MKKPRNFKKLRGSSYFWTGVPSNRSGVGELHTAMPFLHLLLTADVAVLKCFHTLEVQSS